MVEKMSDRGIQALIQFEGKRNKAYKDTAGLWTIGVGHLIRKDEPHLLTATLTDQEILDLLKEDLKEHERLTVSLFGKDLPQLIFDALCDFMFNAGYGNVKKSSVYALIKAKKYKEAADALENWGGIKRPPGLVKRRAEEAKWIRLSILKGEV